MIDYNSYCETLFEYDNQGKLKNISTTVVDYRQALKEVMSLLPKVAFTRLLLSNNPVVRAYAKMAYEKFKEDNEC